MGTPMLRDRLKALGFCIGRRRVAQLMRLMGIEALYRKKRTARRNPDHPVFPYLWRGLTIDRPDQVWAADICYIPMQRGFLYLFAIIDCATRRILAWRLSNTLTTDFCIEAVQEAIAKAESEDTSSSTTASGRTRRLTVARRTRHTSLYGPPR